MYPTSNVLHRVFNLRVRTNGENWISGTMFAVDVDGRRYFVTARHIGKHIGSNGIQVMRNGDWVSYPAELVGHGSGKVDVSVMALPDSFIPNEPRFPLPMGFSGATLGEEMMFLGFPVVNDPSKGFSLYNGFPLPLVKYARLSAMPTPNYPMWLDGHNNPGFSGSPLCFASNKANELVVAGVVVAYPPSKEQVYSADGRETGFYVRENTGFILAWDIKHCVDIINHNPIGLEVK